jgi:serine/threonine protein kinase
MAPEQIKGEPIDGRTDVYALGCMLYEMVTARMPFEGPTIMALLSKHLIEAPVPPSQRRPDLGISPAIDQLVLAAMAKDPRQRPATMEQYGEMIAALAQTVDPNRSQPMSVERPIIPVVTPAAPSAYSAPPVVGKKSRAPLYAVLGVLVLGGGGLAAYLATRPSPHTDPRPGSNAPAPGPTQPDPWKESIDASGPDPWNTPSTSATPQQEVDVGTAATPIPAGAKLIVPSTWSPYNPVPGNIGYTDPSTGIIVAMGPLVAGTNDPKQLAQIWSTTTGAHLEGVDKLYSAGAMRDMAGYTATVDGVDVIQVIVFYPTKRYRIGVLYQAPKSITSSADFQREFLAFFKDGVKLP